MSGGEYLPKSTRTQAREAFFLEFASLIRTNFPKIPLMVTGGFRSLSGMEDAVASKQTDMVGLGRPAALDGKLPKDVLLNVATEKESVHLETPRKELPWILKMIPVKSIGAGADSVSYSSLGS
jgi:2,4-dienoyl-CoA reductase-like NADH-dependent reductase (Old Yellow Enzyme family)